MARRRLLIDLGRSRTRWLLGFFLIAGVLEVFLLTLGGLELLEFTDSPAFCGALCHQVMEPEYTAYQASPHARVPCVECHVGSGTNYLVRSKVTGIPLILRTITGRYPRPITSPVHDLRPARETCQRCHWPQKLAQDRLRLFDHFASEESNTREARLLVFRMGSGQAAAGVHWHIAARITYLPLDEARQQIAWVRVETPDGRVTEYVNLERPAEVTPQRIQREGRFFDCIDCHNRATHVFRSPDSLLDNALSRGDLDPALPFIKKKGLEVLQPDKTLEQAFRQAEALDEFYRRSYPELYGQKTREIQQAIEALKGLARLAIFPQMQVTWETHIDNATHTGCFRCHGRLVATTPNGEAREIRANCTLCHYDLPPGAAQAIIGPVPVAPAVSFVPHSVKEFPDCLGCHATGVGGTPRVPPDHADMTNRLCLDCHQVTPQPRPYVAGGPKPVPHPVFAGEPCLLCHEEGLAGAPRMPADHASRTSEVCLACHGLVLTPATMVGKPPPVLHPTFSGEPCLLCHEEGLAGAPRLPADHAGRANEMCAACHGLTLSPPPASLQPPAIPHPTFSGEPCLLCHAEGKAGAPRMPADHAGRTEELCTGCHRLTLAPIPVSEQPPAVPHTALTGEPCLLCHAQGRAGAPQVPADHKGRTNELCLACHRLPP
ncbi:MAG: NapC/NirT family cytochrome c [Chloroflexi bacterium]|nr:NapC/NirT family cytochrome c [Chloroflexota bacterium]